ncbi:MAG: DMT family transporter [Burkholderiaceae bacterium]
MIPAAPSSPSAAPAPDGDAPSSAEAARRANRRGIRFMVAAMACFIANDAMVKLASASLPAAQLIFVRGMMATLLVLLVARATGTPIVPRLLMRGPVALRSGLDALASLTYLVSLFNLPLANATAINMASPLLIVALAVPLLGERVDARRWAAIAAGFAGVLMVIQPRPEGFNGYALLCLFAAGLHALRDLVTRRIPTGVPSLAITLSTAVAVTVLAGLLSMLQGWAPLTTGSLALLAAASVFLASGYHLMIRGTRIGDMSAIAPWRYTGLLWALILGWVVWGDVPNALGWAGITLLMAAGLYLIRRDRLR